MEPKLAFSSSSPLPFSPYLSSPLLSILPLFLLSSIQALVWEERTKRGFQQWVDQERMLRYAKSRAIGPNGFATIPQHRAEHRSVFTFKEGLVFKLFGAE